MIVGGLALGLAVFANTPLVTRLVRVPLRVNFPDEGEIHREFNDIKPGIRFNEVIPSWNFDNAMNGAIRVELRVNTQPVKANGTFLPIGRAINRGHPAKARTDKKTRTPMY